MVSAPISQHCADLPFLCCIRQAELQGDNLLHAQFKGHKQPNASLRQVFAMSFKRLISRSGKKQHGDGKFSAKPRITSLPSIVGAVGRAGWVEGTHRIYLSFES